MPHATRDMAMPLGGQPLNLYIFLGAIRHYRTGPMPSSHDNPGFALTLDA